METARVVLSNREEPEPIELELRLKVANQRLQLRQQNDSFWRKKHANRILREKVEELSARVKELDPAWYEAWRDTRRK